ncbi:MAG: alpha/beta fold hydrolase [Acidimicrobiales bacterium]|jgi:pimeloyl-ACP methyl ester carboxylesterase
MTTFVLVHGAWGGSYGFRKVRPLLWGAGHAVFTPSLTGIGERSHLTSPQINLSTHITDVVNTVLYEDLEDIVLLGFSYGGMVVTGCLDHIGDRVKALVYLDAFVPADGENVMDRIGHGGPRQIQLAEDWHMAPRPRELADPAEQAWSEARRSLQPLGTFREAVSLSKPLEEFDFSLTYVKATADPDESPDSFFWDAANAAKASDAWAYHEIPTHHLVPLTHPDELAAILRDLA